MAAFDVDPTNRYDQVLDSPTELTLQPETPLEIMDCTKDVSLSPEYSTRTDLPLTKSKRRNELRRERERNRYRTLIKAVDALQGHVWREKISLPLQRRSRAAVLRTASDYIALLTDFVDDKLSSSLSKKVYDLVTEKPEEQRFDRARAVRQALGQHNEEKEKKKSEKDRTSFSLEKALSVEIEHMFVAQSSHYTKPIKCWTSDWAQLIDA